MAMPGPTSDTAPAFTEWLDAFFISYYRRRPVTATYAGDHQHDGSLPDYSERGVDDALSDTQILLSELASLPPERLSTEQLLDWQTAEGFLRTQLWEYDSAQFRWSNPSLHTGEAIFGIISLLLLERTPLAERLQLVASRLSAIPELLAQAQATVTTAPIEWIARARKESAAALTLLGDGIDRYLADSGAESESVRNAADRAIGAFVAFDLYLEYELLPKATASYACGAEAFAMLLRDAHFLDIDAAGLEARALDQLERAEAALLEGAKRFGTADWQTVLAGQADVHPTAEAFPGRFKELWDSSRAAIRAHDMVTLPDWPVSFEPQPAWIKPVASSLYFIPYRMPAPLDPLTGGVQYIPTVPSGDEAAQARQLRATNDHVIKQNYIVHHSAIGHHTQNWYAANAKSRVGQLAAVDGASRIAMLCGGTLAEGWASYTTDLVDEIGFLSPLESFAQVYAQLRMAARAVVDVRLHEGRITLEEGQRFYEERVGMAAGASKAEVVKNSLFPATGCMYLAGWDGIQRLRKAVSARDGAAFSQRRFHDQLLSYGAVPVALVADVMLGAGVGAAR